MNLQTTIDLYAGIQRSPHVFRVGDAVTYYMTGPTGVGHGTYLGRVVELLDNGQAQVRFSMPNGKSTVHQTMVVPVIKLNKAPIKAFGEPAAGVNWYAHLQPMPSFHPPSKRKKTPVPTDDPMETDDKFLDVTKRKSKDTELFRKKLMVRNHQPPNLGPNGTGPNAVTGVIPQTAGFAMFGKGK